MVRLTPYSTSPGRLWVEAPTTPYVPATTSASAANATAARGAGHRPTRDRDGLTGRNCAPPARNLARLDIAAPCGVVADAPMARAAPAVTSSERNSSCPAG